MRWLSHLLQYSHHIFFSDLNMCAGRFAGFTAAVVGDIVNNLLMLADERRLILNMMNIFHTDTLHLLSQRVDHLDQALVSRRAVNGFVKRNIIVDNAFLIIFKGGFLKATVAFLQLFDILLCCVFGR